MFNQLQNNYFVQVPFPLPRTQIEEAIHAFFAFLEQPDDIKKHIDFTIAPLHRRGDVGFKHRDPGGGIYNDSKDFFHYHPAILDKYDSFLKNYPVAQHFMKKAQSIWEAATRVLKQIFSKFEPDFPGLSSKIFEAEHPHILVRFLKYSWQHAQKYLAKPHFDAGSFTLGIAESCPGLRIGSHPQDLKIVEHEEGKAIFMLSSNFQKVMPGFPLKPAWHDVIQLDDTKIGKSYARWAVVVFVDADGVEALPRTETRKWTLSHL